MLFISSYRALRSSFIKHLSSNYRSHETVPEVSVQTPVSSNENQKYFIIGGAFELPQNAEAFVKTLKAAGFTDARIVGSSGRLEMVCFKGFSARTEAVKELENLKAQNKSGWIFVR